MPLVYSFIGWHNAGKTTLARQVVTHLTAMGYVVGVIKSTKEHGLIFDQPETDTDRYRTAGASGVALSAPDQLVLINQPPGLDLPSLAAWLFPCADVVIAEGFKQAAGVPKIEVRRDGEAPLLRDQVEGVIAVATDLPLTGGLVFRLDQSQKIAALIAARTPLSRRPPSAAVSPQEKP